MSSSKEASPTARMRAERADQQARERDIVKAETVAAAQALDDRTARLRQLRLAKEKTDGEAAEAVEAAKVAAKVAAKAAKKPAKKAAPKAKKVSA